MASNQATRNVVMFEAANALFGVTDFGDPF
jgi:hypothetical protein